MSFAIHPQREYLVALLGLAAGGGAGLVATMRASRSIKRWDARVTIPLLLAATGGHLVLIPFVERQHQMLLGRMSQPFLPSWLWLWRADRPSHRAARHPLARQGR